MAIVKPNLGEHFGEVMNPLTFQEAYKSIIRHPDQIFETTGNGAKFTVKATTTIKGPHKGEPVLRFFSGDRETARAYPCCWGCKTNCNKTHIDCYTAAVNI